MLGSLRSFQSKASSFLLFMFVGLFFFGFFVNQSLQRQFHISEPVLVDILPGEGAGGVARRLAQKGLVSNPFPLIIRARIVGANESIKAGTYEITRSDTPELLLNNFFSGATKKFSITFKEGSSFADIVDRLSYSDRLNNSENLKEIRIDFLDDFLHKNKINFVNYEGLFFPDTYFYESDDKPSLILQMAAKKMVDVLSICWQNKELGLFYKSPYEALIMASIIEKESAMASESHIISGIFQRRLGLGMRLQADPTVIYGLGQEFDGRLTYSGLKKDTPYNTYTRNGLPVTPISSPGLVSIKAALRPAKTNYLYFMAKGDGSHEFSATLEEHNIAVDQYREKKQ
jgi:UPF0755 protein